MKNTMKFTNFSLEEGKTLVNQGQRVPYIQIILPRRSDEENCQIILQYQDKDWVKNGSVFFRLNSYIFEPHVVFFGNIIQKTNFINLGYLLEDINIKFKTYVEEEQKQEEIVDNQLHLNPTVYNYNNLIMQMNKGQRASW